MSLPTSAKADGDLDRPVGVAGGRKPRRHRPPVAEVLAVVIPGRDLQTEAGHGVVSVARRYDTSI